MGRKEKLEKEITFLQEEFRGYFFDFDSITHR